MNIFKPKTKANKLIKKAFKLRGTQFYEFANILDMPKLRFQAEGRFLTELQIKIDMDTLKATIEKSMEWLNKGNITKSIILQNDLLEQSKIAIGFETIYRLVSCHYFYLDENVDYYDYEIGDEKIKLFKNEKLASFFLNEPIRQFLPPSDISGEDLGAYYTHEKELKNLRLKHLTEMN